MGNRTALLLLLLPAHACGFQVPSIGTRRPMPAQGNFRNTAETGPFVSRSLAGRQANPRIVMDLQSAAVNDAKDAESEPNIPYSQIPGSFGILMGQVQKAVKEAIDAGEMLMEVEFPPLPTSILEDSLTAANDITDANTRLAIDLAKEFATQADPKRVAITLPDQAEWERTVETVVETEEPFPGVKMHSLSNAQFKGLLGLVLGSDRDVRVAENADMYIIIVSSCQELPDIEKLHELDPTKPKVLFNLKLNTLRGDLGLPAFPSKDLQRRFLCKIKPVYYMLPRDYTLTINRPPYLLAYSGVLFRVYPENYQMLLDVGKGKRRQAKLDSRRPGLGEFKQVLIDSLKMEEGSFAVSTTGYKTQTWYEEDEQLELNMSGDWIN